MKFTNPKLLRENKVTILENVKLGKQYVQQGKLSEEDLKKLIEIDPTPQKKYVGWMSKIWITEKPDLDVLRNTVEEYNTFLNKDKAKTKDINKFKSFKALHDEVDQINQSGEGVSVKDLENDYDTVIDNDRLLIMSPHTHEASRKLGLSHFSFRDCKGGKDSAWCTTYKAPDHFNDYYYTNNVTFYYIRVKSPELIQKLKEAFPRMYKELEVVALAVLDNGEIDGYDGLDRQMSSKDIKIFTNIIGIK
jgi:hypothetical protein